MRPPALRVALAQVNPTVGDLDGNAGLVERWAVHAAAQGAHLVLFPELMDELRARGAEDVVVFGGGIIPEADIPELTRIGVSRIFGPGTPMQEIVDWVGAHVVPARA